MADYPTRRLALVMQREVVQSRWATEQWNLVGATADPGGEARVVREEPSIVEFLHPGFEVALYPDEAEGYFLNVTTEEPSVFVSLRADEATGEVRPFQATLSYNEAARWMDGSERVERIALPPEFVAWMSEWVEANYRPEPKKRRKPRSFEGRGELREKDGA